MRADEVRATGELLGGAVGGFGRLIGDFHEAIAGRVFAAVGPLGAPVRIIHGGISTAVHKGVSGALAAPPRAAGALVASKAHLDGAPLDRSLPGGLAVAALNGAIGDLLSASGSPLALGMSLRARGEPVELEPPAVAAAYPQATGRLAVFVHGLCEDEDAWRPGLLPTRRREQVSYGSRLRRDHGYTPVYLRYNTGLHISDNGRSLSRLLEDLVDAWPRPVEEIVLIGHSMGGLVARSACHYGHAGDARWVEPLRHVFCLGSPHLGAPLEKGANLASWALSRLPETRPLAKVVNGRSVGIKDLRFGSCVEEDWCDCEPDEFLRDRCREVPFLETATYYFVGATLGRGERSALGSLVGDLLVRYPSASGSGRRRRIGFTVDHGCRLTGLTHFDLLNHPAVYERIAAWLTRGGGELAAGAAPPALPPAAGGFG